MSEPKQPTHVFLVSYHPLLSPEQARMLAGSFVDATEAQLRQITKMLEKLPSGCAEACLWAYFPLGEEGPGRSVFPVLAIERGREIAKHLVEWAEGQPEEWFELVFTKNERNPDQYALALVPSFEKSIARYKLARLIFAEEIAAKKEQFTLLFSPLRFGAYRTTMDIDKVVGLMEVPTHVGIIDRKHVRPDREPPFDLDKIEVLGPFKAGDASVYKNYFADFFETLGPPLRRRSRKRR